MERDYEIFEVCPDRTVMWRSWARGTRIALAKLEQISKETTNECFAINLASQEVLGRVNEASSRQSIAS